MTIISACVHTPGFGLDHTYEGSAVARKAIQARLDRAIKEGEKPTVEVVNYPIQQTHRIYFLFDNGAAIASLLVKS